ncbi:MAG TPA: hypothetical protein VMU14_25135, partial [Acidimicrobiales bacterium]|nr:hypothetical protein [Acidimicrobiales bacterium]
STTTSTTSTTVGGAGPAGAPAGDEQGGARRLSFTGAGLDMAGPDFTPGTLPQPGQRLLITGALLDASGAVAGQLLGTYVQLVPFGDAGAGDAVGLIDEVLSLADGTICGRGLGLADPGSALTFAITGGTGKYAALTGTYSGAQQFLNMGGDGSALLTFTTTPEGSDHGAG